MGPIPNPLSLPTTQAIVASTSEIVVPTPITWNLTGQKRVQQFSTLGPEGTILYYAPPLLCLISGYEQPSYSCTSNPKINIQLCETMQLHSVSHWSRNAYLACVNPSHAATLSDCVPGLASGPHPTCLTLSFEVLQEKFRAFLGFEIA